jgi:pimeloyl-ACP methyl ester carboxylesterase
MILLVLLLTRLCVGFTPIVNKGFHSCLQATTTTTSIPTIISPPTLPDDIIMPVIVPNHVETSLSLRMSRVPHDFNVSSLHNHDNKPKAVFLPGLDGIGAYAMSSLRNVSVDYDLYKLEIQPDDRSSFVQVANVVIDTLKSFDMPVTLIGESFGGLLATYIASQNKALVSTLVLVNPATSYERTSWETLGPLIINSGRAFPVVGMATLLATVVQPDQFTRIGRVIVDQIQASDDPIKELNGLFNMSQEVVRLLAPETLEWRLTRWLKNGNLIMKDRYKDITTPTVLLIGKQDRLLPSDTEGYRLEQELTNAAVEVVEFRTGGHALLDDSRDLADILRKSKTLGPAEDLQPNLDVPFPSQAEIDEADRNVLSTLTRAFSPVFLQKDAKGQLRRGIDSLPVGTSGRPVLLVGNHQLYGADTGFIIREFIRSRQVLVRGLAHPILFGAASPGGAADSNMFSRNNIQKFGGVEVSPGSIFQLMKNNETILLFPGGANEACHGKGEAYKLKWSESVDFVRMAAAFDAIIVPFGAIGVADSFNMLLDGQDLNNLPFIGTSMRRFASRLPRAKASVPESINFPFALPKTPRRIYFLFQQPYDTRSLNMYNKTESRVAYKFIQRQVEDSIQTLLRFRESDPYDNFPRRAAYEALSGKQAPTAPLTIALDEL